MERATPVPLRRPGPAHALLRTAAPLLFVLVALGAQAQVAVNTTGAAPAGNAILDISSTNKGLLVPRMTRTQKLAIGASGPNYDGLIIYQTDSIGLEPRGYYYYDNTTPLPSWRHLSWGPDSWKLGGNAGTTTANFIGTTNNQPLIFATSGQDHGRITPTGGLELYPTTPAGSTETVEVRGALKLDGGNAGNTDGAIRFVPASGNVPARFEGYVTNNPTTDTDINGWKQLDNHFGVRTHQQSQQLGAGCQLPTSTTSPAALPRPWPFSGPPITTTTSLAEQTPYYSLWEDSHRQYLFTGGDLAALGLCAGNPISAIAFDVAGINYNSTTWGLHFLKFSMKNTSASTTPTYDMGSLTVFAEPNPGPYSGGDPNYHQGGYLVTLGWNVHQWDQGGIGGFVWSGGNLLLDAAVDNQDWPAMEGVIYMYPTSYVSMISRFCDACGGNGTVGSCIWQTAPIIPNGAAHGPPGGVVAGWGWASGWTMNESTNPLLCDGTIPTWGGGSTGTFNKLPRVAFYCTYLGGGVSYDVDSYIYAQDGVMVGDAAWAASGSYPNYKFRGPGTLSAEKSVWSDATLLTDYVFDQYYDGKTRPEDAKAVATYHPVALKDLPNYVERERHLPTIGGRAQWNKDGGFSVDYLTNQLWVTVEQQALYIKELNQRMDALQQYLVLRKLQEIGPEKK